MSDGAIIFKGNFEKELEKFRKQLANYTEGLKGSKVTIQNRTAEILADLYRHFLRQGIEPNQSKITVAYKGGEEPPLSGLADYVTVLYARPGPRIQNRDSKGRYETGFSDQAIVTFTKEFASIALLHDRGYAVNITPERRRAIMRQALENAPKSFFLDDGFSSQGVWIIPARPHAHILGSPEAERILYAVAERIIANKKLPKFSHGRPPRIPIDEIIAREIPLDSIQI